MSDEELEEAFEAAKAELDSPEVENVSDTEDTEDVMDAADVDNVEDTDELDEVDDLEQPEKDSDDDTGDENESDDNESDEPDAEEDNPDEGSETDEGEPEDAVEEAEEDKSQPTQAELNNFLNEVSKTRANGVEYEFTNKEKLEMFDKMFPQATDYTKKMQQIKPWRKTIDAIEQANLKQEDVNLMIDVLKGDKDAIADVLKRTGVDALELDTEEANYVPKDYGRDETELAIKDIVDEISVDPEYQITQNILNNQWDDKSIEAFMKKPSDIRALHIDVKTGVFDKLSPIMNKLKVYDGGTKSDLEYYKLAAQQYAARQQQDHAKAEQATKIDEEKTKLNEVKVRDAKRTSTKKNSAKRKAATPTKKGGSASKKVTDYLDDSDEAFEEWYNKLQDSH